jgi:ankyrin repeat protein
VDNSSKHDLNKLLAKINETLDDFSGKPARSATDTSFSGDTPLHKVAIWGDIEAAKILLKGGADINAPGEDEDTPLHRAVAGERAEMIRFLIANGANPRLMNRYGNSPMSDAEDSGNSDLIIATKSIEK